MKAEDGECQDGPGDRVECHLEHTAGQGDLTLVVHHAPLPSTLISKRPLSQMPAISAAFPLPARCDFHSSCWRKTMTCQAPLDGDSYMNQTLLTPPRTEMFQNILAQWELMLNHLLHVLLSSPFFCSAFWEITGFYSRVNTNSAGGLCGWKNERQNSKCVWHIVHSAAMLPFRALEGNKQSLSVQKELQTFIENGNESTSACTSEHNNRDQL